MKLIKRKNRERGSITVEATISLTTFMFAILTVYAIINVCMVQAKMSIAINSVAKEISQYSYLYALTGIGESHSQISEGGKATQEQINGILGDVNTAFTEMQNVGKSVGKVGEGDISGFITQMETSGKNLEDAGSSLIGEFEDIAEDPKSVAMGLAKIVASKGWNMAMSKVAEGLSKGLCKKNLVFEEGGDPNAYLKFLGVVPAANGSYIDGLDFSESALFPDGSSEIRINVSYKVKVLALLPIDLTFKFNQKAITHGWWTGKDSFRTVEDNVKEYATNSTLWTDSTSPTERQKYIRNQGIKDLSASGFKQVTGSQRGDSYQDIHAYNGETNEFAVIHSMNPLYSAKGEKTVTLDDLNEAVIQKEIENMCAGVSSTAGSLTKIKTKSINNTGDIVYNEYNCTEAKSRVVLVIPEDEGLKAKFETIVAKANTRGVTVELVPSYGNGASTTEVKEESKDGGKSE